MSKQSIIANLVALDIFWLQAAVPITLLEEIQIPHKGNKKGSKVQIILDRSSGSKVMTRTGFVLKMLGDLDPKGRMARLLITVDNPFQLDIKKPTVKHLVKSC